MSKLLRSAVMLSCVVHGSVATHAAEERERTPKPQRGGALPESLTSSNPAFAAPSAVDWAPRAPAATIHPLAKSNVTLGLVDPAEPKRRSSERDWSDLPWRSAHGSQRSPGAALSAVDREERPPFARGTFGRQEARTDSTGRAHRTPPREGSLNSPRSSSSPPDATLLRAVDAVASGSRDWAFPFFRPQQPVAPKQEVADSAEQDVKGLALLGGGPLMYRLDLTRMYGQEAWVKPLLVPQYVVMPEPLVHSSGELPRPIVDEIHALVPAPSSLSLAAAAAVAYGAARAGARRLRRAARSQTPLRQREPGAPNARRRAHSR